MNTFPMPQAASHLCGGRTWRKRNRIAFIDHLRRCNGDTPPLLIRKALLPQRKSRVKPERLVGHLSCQFHASVGTVHQTALREPLNQVAPNTCRGSIDGDSQILNTALSPLQQDVKDDSRDLSFLEP